MSLYSPLYGIWSPCQAQYAAPQVQHAGLGGYLAQQPLANPATQQPLAGVSGFEHLLVNTANPSQTREPEAPEEPFEP